MRKTTILAIATAILAVASVVTDLMRMDTGVTIQLSAIPAAQVQAAGGPESESFDAI